MESPRQELIFRQINMVRADSKLLLATNGFNRKRLQSPLDAFGIIRVDKTVESVLDYLSQEDREAATPIKEAPPHVNKNCTG